MFNDRLVLMNGLVGTNGDSGGGWSYGTKAYGLEKGNCQDVDGHEVFSVADLYDEALDVTVRLSHTAPMGLTIEEDDRLVSADGRFTAVMQTDGNFVVYQNGVGAIWASSWCGQTGFGAGFRAVMQTDGNFVVYPPGGAAAWATTWSQTQPGCQSNQQTVMWPGTNMVMQDDGNLVMYLPGYGAVWATNTGGR